MSVEEQVLQETLEFERQLASLLETIPGRWVVFKGGRVVSEHKTLEEAYDAGIKAFGAAGGHAVLQVAPRNPQPISASVLFGIK